MKTEQTLQCTYFSGIKIVQMVLNELDCSREIRLIEFVRDVPADWTEFTSFLKHRITHNFYLQCFQFD